MIFLSRLNDFGCILPCQFVCGQFSNDVDRAEFTRKMDGIATFSPIFNFYNSFWNVNHIKILDLSIVLAVNTAQSIYC